MKLKRYCKPDKAFAFFSSWKKQIKFFEQNLTSLCVVQVILFLPSEQTKLAKIFSRRMLLLQL